MINSKVKTKSGDEPIIAYTVSEYRPRTVAFKPLQRNHKFIDYAVQFMTLDTETSHIGDEDSWIYQWAAKWRGEYIYGRKPSEIVNLLEKLAEYYELSDKRRIIICIHNVSYDVQYLKHFLAKYDPTIKIMAIDNHTMLQIDIFGFRIICSYKLSNMSLDTLSKNYAKKYVKAVGEIDYTKVRYQDSKLNDNDWYYMFSDVASQHDGVTQYIHTMGYKYMFECPITSTGFVRVACRKAALAQEGYREMFEGSRLTLPQYKLCRQAFMGGVTIQSFIYAGQTVRSKRLRHKDFTSSYPARQKINYMPVGAPMDYGNINDMQTFETLLSKYCCIFILELDEVHIKEGITAPYIPSSKLIGSHKDDEVLKVNGKVVYAKRLRIAICELDYEIIKRQYTFENMRIGSMTIFKRGSAPEWLKGEVMYYFENKCKLKGLDEELYMKSKAFLNAIYGMTATQILREVFKIDDEMIITKQEAKDEESQTKELDKYYKSYNSFMPYQLAVYTTAWARYALVVGLIETVGYENFLYCDTDSVFYLETPENKKKMEEYRKQCIDDAIKHNAYIGNKYLGEPTDEPPIRAFRGLHAKCYAMEELNDETGKYELKVTIAGIPKKSTKFINGKAVTMTNAQELGKIDNLVDGFKFKHCGGTRAIYNERPIEYKNINGHMTELASNVIIENIEKEISDTMWTQDGDELCKILYTDNM